MDVEVHCVKTGKNTTKCAAWDNDDPGGIYWQGTCTKHKDGTLELRADIDGTP